MKQKLLHYFGISTVALFVIGCTNANDANLETDKDKVIYFDLETIKPIIEEKTNRFTEAHILKDTAFLNDCFSEDARIFPPNADVVTGQAAIEQLNYDWVNYGVYEFDKTSTALYGNAEYLIDEGIYYLRYGDDNTIDKGKYINIWKNEDGIWKLFSNMWNTSLPPATN